MKPVKIIHVFNVTIVKVDEISCRYDDTDSAIGFVKQLWNERVHMKSIDNKFNGLTSINCSERKPFSYYG
jgi:6-phosphogluconolactonase/glucosamine-6-phosphate isomerase/deaminase